MDSAGERFAAIREAVADRKNILTVKELCELAGVSCSGYYNWGRSNRARETREQKDLADFRGASVPQLCKWCPLHPHTAAAHGCADECEEDPRFSQINYPIQCAHL